VTSLAHQKINEKNPFLALTKSKFVEYSRIYEEYEDFGKKN
jgi:hypothetical protein